MSRFQQKMSRRKFLISVGAGFIWIAAACGRKKATPTATSIPPTQVPSQAPTTVPTRPAVTLTPTTAPSPTATPTTAPSSTATVAQKGLDTIYINGKVITVDAKDTIAQAVAVKDGLIQAVGTTEDIRRLASQNTEVVDLKNALMTPGMVDPHNHVQVMGLINAEYIPLLKPRVVNIADMQKVIAEELKKIPAGQWLQGYYFHLDEMHPPTRQELDAASPRHPVWIMHQSGHIGSGNSLALKAANITAATRDPVGGIIERDAKGEPDGVLYNHSAMDLLRVKIPPKAGGSSARDYIRTSQPLLAAVGVTTFYDNYVRGSDNINAYLDADRNKEMILRGAIYPVLEYEPELERMLKLEKYKGAMMRLAGFKLQLDGSAETAYCHEAHKGIRWDVPRWDPKVYKKVVRGLHEAGFQICTHCVGDAATDLALDAYEEAMKAAPRPDPRHRIEHCVLCTATAVKRMKDLGVLVSDSAAFLSSNGEYYIDHFGAERAKRVMVAREWWDAGVSVSINSDNPTTPWYAPQMTMFSAISRRLYTGNVLNQGQALTRLEALRAHTYNAAYAGFEEKIKGSIEPGKLADFVIWKEDFLTKTLTMENTQQGLIAMTIIAGKTVFKA